MVSSTETAPDVFLGVDGGGTKTALVLVDARGELLASSLAPSCYYLGQGIGLVERVLEQGVGAVCEQAALAPSEIRHAFFGLPGYGEVSSDLPELDAVPARVLGHQRYACDNDMVAGWAGSLGAADGINVISGTGSMTYGRRGDRGVRIGGWGELFDDEGSAYWIAIRGLSLFAKMSDGRLPPSRLHMLLKEHLALAADLDLVDVVLNRWGGDRSEVASLARVVGAAAEAGDDSCVAVLIEAGTMLAGLVLDTRARLGFDDDEVTAVSWSGGVFASEIVRSTFRAALADSAVDLRSPLLPPVAGAALYAARLAGTPMTKAAVRRLQHHAATLPQGGTDV